MIIHIILYLLIAVLVFTFNVINASYLPFIVNVVFVIVSILGIITVVIHNGYIDVELESENSVATRTEKYLVRFLVRNKGFLPLTRCKIITRVSYKGRNIKKIYKKSVSCGSNSETQCEFFIDCPSCEMVSIECVKIRVYDYLGLFILPKKVSKSSTVIVMPNLPTVDITDKMSYVLNEEEGIIYSQERPGDDATEIFAIREYVPGDNIRKIHWKLTTKSDNLMVKDYGLPIKNNDTVVIDIFKEPKNVPDNRDELFDLFYGLVYSMTKRGYGFNACFYNGEYVTARIENQNDIYALFAQVYDIKPYDKQVTAAEFFYSNRINNQNRVFYVTGQLDEFTYGQLNLLTGIGKTYYLIPGHFHDSYMPVRYEG